MIAGHGDCSPNSPRTPYRVHSILYEVSEFKATLKVTTVKWKDLSYNFHAESRPSGKGATKRGVAKGGKGISLERTYNVGFKIAKKDSVAIKVECEKCQTQGNIGYSFDIKQVRIINPFRIQEYLVPKKTTANCLLLSRTLLGGQIKLSSRSILKV